MLGTEMTFLSSEMTAAWKKWQASQRREKPKQDEQIAKNRTAVKQRLRARKSRFALISNAKKRAA
ncbi:MAG TPA: hypothetical protein VGI45_26555 [Terracidiphilus sp.]|jgi:hypothetical protein